MKSSATLLYCSLRLYCPLCTCSVLMDDTRFPGVAGATSVQEPRVPLSKPGLSYGGMMGVAVAAGAHAVVAWQ